jgi:hypothetical protein
MFISDKGLVSEMDEELSKFNNNAGRWRLMPVIPAPQEAEIRRITVQSQARQVVPETLSQKYPS